MAEEAAIPLDRLARAYRKIRGRIAELTQAYDNEVEALKGQQAEIANAMKDAMRAMGVSSVRTDAGTVVLGTKTRYAASDWDGLKAFILEQGALDLLEKRIAQGNMKQFLEENPGLLPPGLNSFVEYEVSVRKPTK
jgi:hypothetical protein